MAPLKGFGVDIRQLLELILIRIALLLPYIGSPVSGRPCNKSPTVWGIYTGAP